MNYRSVESWIGQCVGCGVLVTVTVSLILAGGCGDDDGGCPDSMLSCGSECVDPQVDPDHCGDCETVCGTNAVCEAGVCACQGDSVDCGGECVDTDQDPHHCGDCDAACEDPLHGSGVCVGGSCGMVCDTGYLDCDADEATGCEIDGTTDASSCGSCGTVCEETNATNGCIAGVCTPTCDVLWDDCDGDPTNGCELDVSVDENNCGSCQNVCTGAQAYCVGGTCIAEPPSCAAALAADPNAGDGVYALHPPGAPAPFDAYCDMTTQGGGWTLMAIIVNDATLNWDPLNLAWVDNQAFGAAWDPTYAGDAKSPGWHTVLADELMIVAAPGTVEVVTDASCLQGNPMAWLMQRDSEDDEDCAHRCTTVLLAGPWAAAAWGGSFLMFRCDDNYDETDVGGFLMSSDDNSMITTLPNYNGIDTFGLGSGSAPDHVDFNSSVGGLSDPSDTTPRLLYLR